MQAHVQRLQDLLKLELFAVGGCVRDEILGRPVKDYDFATKSPPDDIERAIVTAGKRVYTVGKRFGTLAFKDSQSGMVEITSFREEQYTPGSRKPTVAFVDSIDGDLSRRDFTMNALAMGADGQLVDMHGGVKHMMQRLICCVGDPVERFSEDPLRIVRAVRFAVELEFQLEENMKKALQAKSYLLLSISKERLVTEIDKMFNVSPARSCMLLYQMGILYNIVPEFSMVIPFKHLEQSGELEIFRFNQMYITGIDVERTTQGWSALFKCLADGLLFEDYLEATTKDIEDEMSALNVKRNMVYKDLIVKYAAHFKFSKQRTNELGGTCRPFLPLAVSIGTN